MTRHGVCLPTDPAQQPLAGELQPFGVVRPVALNQPEFYAAVRDYQTHGLTVAVVMDHDTLGDDPFGWAWACEDLVRHCRPELIIIGNEMDNLAPSSTSWTMTPTAYARMWMICEVAIRSRWAEARLCIGGQVSGLPWRAAEYVRAVQRAGGQPDSIDIHPYAKDAFEAELLLEMYGEALPNLTLQVLEWNREADQIADYVRMLERVGVELACYFSWVPFDIPALLDEEGRPTDRYWSYAAAVADGGKTDGNVDEEISTEEDMPEFVLGFKQYAKDHPEVGKPVENEHPFGGNYNVQMTTAGLLVYSVEANQIAFLPKG